MPIDRYILLSLTPPACNHSTFSKNQEEEKVLQIFHLNNTQGRKKVINRRCRLKGLIFENYPKFKSLCHSCNIECPEENSWAFSIYKNETNITKEQKNIPSSITPEKSYVKMGSRRFTSPPTTKLLRSTAAEDDDNGKIIKALSLFNTL